MNSAIDIDEKKCNTKNEQHKRKEMESEVKEGKQNEQSQNRKESSKLHNARKTLKLFRSSRTDKQKIILKDLNE